MSLYRQPGRASARTIALAVGIALLVGLLGGFGIGRATGGDDEPTISEAVATLRGDLRPALSGLGLVRIEYAQAVKDRRVAEPTEYAAAKADVARARAAVRASSDDLRALSPPQAAIAEQALAQLAAAVDAKAETAEVDRLAGQAETALRAATASD
jgi:hypothetical protein